MFLPPEIMIILLKKNSKKSFFLLKNTLVSDKLKVNIDQNQTN